MTRIAITAIIGIAGSLGLAMPAAAFTQGNQWRPIPETMASLVADGYELRSVVQHHKGGMLYFLQKDTTVAQCVALPGPEAAQECTVLVQPYKP